MSLFYCTLHDRQEDSDIVGHTVIQDGREFCTNDRTKKYHLFTFGCYYPLGGAEDYDNSYETLQEALDKAKNDNFWNIMETQEDGSLKLVADFHYGIHKKGKEKG